MTAARARTVVILLLPLALAACAAQRPVGFTYCDCCVSSAAPSTRLGETRIHIRNTSGERVHAYRP